MARNPSKVSCWPRVNVSLRLDVSHQWPTWILTKSSSKSSWGTPELQMSSSVKFCQGLSSLMVWRIGRDADATVLRSLDVHHVPSRVQHREVRQNTARARQSSDLLQLVKCFQLLSSFGYEAIAMPWAWTSQGCREARKNNSIYVQLHWW